MSGLGIAALAILGPVAVLLAVAIVLRLRERLRCRCGHQLRAHRHYRPGSDCGLCECPRWTRRYSASELTDPSRDDIDPNWPGIRDTLPGDDGQAPGGGP